MRLFMAVLLFFVFIPANVYTVELADPNFDGIFMWYDSGVPDEEQFTRIGPGLYFDGTTLYGIAKHYVLNSLSDTDCMTSAGYCSLTEEEVKNTIISTYGWDGASDCTIQLPLANRFYKVILLMGVADADSSFYILPRSTNMVYLDTVPQIDGARVQNATPNIAEMIVCQTFTIDGSTYDWLCNTVTDGWVNGN